MMIQSGSCLVTLLLTAMVARGEKPLAEFFAGGAAATTPATGTTSRPIAEINGEPIAESEFLDLLLDSCGGRILREMVLLAGARQLAEAQGVHLTDEDFNGELNRIVGALGPKTTAEGQALSADDRRRILRVVLARRGMSYDEFVLGVKRQAYLRAVARKQTQVTDEMIQEEHRRTYGPRRELSAIVVADLKVAQRLSERLKGGGDFATLAASFSIDLGSASAGGSLGVVAENDTELPAVVKKVAFELPEGSISPIVRVGDAYWVIRIDRKLDPQPIEMESVKESLRAQAAERYERKLMDKLQQELLSDSRIRIHHSRLERQFRQWRQSQQGLGD